ncbi:MAG: hypothetical protein U5K74_03235 [Gemmatimonadaceae bacterium]|nr:hypothetical protein [Gemmatimonadaceae bacterium]
MSFAREGYPLMGASSLIAIGVLAASVWRRKWSLWLLGFLLLLVSASIAWSYRAPDRGVGDGAPVTGADR